MDERAVWTCTERAATFGAWAAVVGTQLTGQDLGERASSLKP